MTTREIRKNSKAISGAIYDWLKAEVDSSSQPDDRNLYLNSRAAGMLALTYPYDDDRNATGVKDRNHQDRLPIWYQGFIAGLDPTFTDQKMKDFTAAKMPFAALMEASGAFRIQSYLMVKEQTEGDPKEIERLAQAEYEEIRSAAINVNVGAIALDYMTNNFPRGIDFANNPLTAEHLLAVQERRAAIGEYGIKSLCAQIMNGMRPEASINMMNTVQENWLRLAFSYIAFIAKTRGGDLAAVPFLEARSISDASEIYFPFAK